MILKLSCYVLVSSCRSINVKKSYKVFMLEKVKWICIKQYNFVTKFLCPLISDWYVHTPRRAFDILNFGKNYPGKMQKSPGKTLEILRNFQIIFGWEPWVVQRNAQVLVQIRRKSNASFIYLYWILQNDPLKRVWHFESPLPPIFHTHSVKNIAHLYELLLWKLRFG